MDESVTDYACLNDRQNQEITERFREHAKKQIRRGQEQTSEFDETEPLIALGKPSGLGISVSDFNVEAFLHHFDGMDMTEDEKHEVLHALWEIMSRFVELGFGLDAHTLAQKADSSCGKPQSGDAGDLADLVE